MDAIVATIVDRGQAIVDSDSRGAGTRFDKFSNGPKTNSECSNLLY
jgi:hypothetical protein